jgi:LPS export ABC transporter protein LptC
VTHNTKIYLLYIRIAVLLVGTAIFFSCDENLEIASTAEIEKLPALTVKDFQSVYTDSGHVQVVTKAPLLERYPGEDAPFNEFTKGITVTFYKGNSEPSAFISSDYAKYFELDKLWELKYNVVVRTEKNELLETELLYWDETKDLVYTDRFVRITSEDRIVSGTGFESDSRFTKTTILKGNLIIYLDDE